MHFENWPLQPRPQIRSQGVIGSAHSKVSSTIPNNCGVLQGVILSPFFFTLYTSYLFSESQVFLLKYADNVVLSQLFRDAQSLYINNNALKYVPEWYG